MTNLKINQHYERLIFIIIAALVIYVRLRYADMAMERDEGEYAYAGSQILRGGFPFKDFYNMKLPGVYYCYALIMALLGKTVVSARIAVLILNLSSAILLIKIGEKWINNKAGWLAGAFYLFLALSVTAQGIIANCEHFVVFFLLFTLWSFSKEWFFIAGLSAAFTVFMKQQGAILLCFGFIYFIYVHISTKGKRSFIKKIALSGLGFALPFALFFATVWHKDVYASFKFFAIDYAKAYISIGTPHTNFRAFQEIMDESKGLWLAGKVSLVVAILGGIFYKKTDFKTPLNPLFLIVFLLFSYAAILPGWYYRQHYYHFLFPAVALLMAYGWSFFTYLSQTHWVLKLFQVALLVTCFGEAMYRQKDFLFENSPQKQLTNMYIGEGFHELREVGTVIKNSSLKTDTLGLMGHEPQMLFYADRVSASGYMYSYPFLEDQPYSMQMAYQYNKEIKAAKPKWFVDCFHWYQWTWFHTRIPMEDTDVFIKKNYYLRGALYIDGKIEWEIDSVQTQRYALAIVYERKDSGQMKPTPLVFDGK